MVRVGFGTRLGACPRSHTAQQDLHEDSFNPLHKFSADIIPGQKNFVFLTGPFYADTRMRAGGSE